MCDPGNVISHLDLGLSRDLTYEEVPLTILGGIAHAKESRSAFDFNLMVPTWKRISYMGKRR
ncbi:hypothetical protein ACS0TY_027526 [Phlomoides rotata]